MLNGLRCMVNWLVEDRSITYVVMYNGSSVPILPIRRWINHKFSLPIL
jgi:hypothetical protein